MELALNIGWLAISLAAFVYFGRHALAKGDTQSVLIACIALICVTSLLFPIISMTDDLNSAVALPEATKFKRLLASSGQMVIHLFSLALIYAPPARTWSALALQREVRPIYRAFLSFNLSRRPPPVLQSL